MRKIGDKKVFGFVVDDETRCKHYSSRKDIVAIKFNCCKKYYPCYKCHEESENHPITVWKKSEYDERAILCGACKKELTINEYLYAERCVYCHSTFNAGCQTHYHLYFE